MAGFVEYPVFVPHDDDHLAAVVTLPRGPSRGLVALLTGIGTGRSHRFQVWTRTARALASRGMASVRLDWVGIGDSSGVLEAWTWALEEDLLDQARTVLRTTARAVGTDRTAAVGNCFGARIALRLSAEEPSSTGSACILLPMTPGAPDRALRRAGGVRIAGFLRRNRWVRRLVIRRVKALHGIDKTARDCIEKTLSRGRLLLLYGQDDQVLSTKTTRQMEELVAAMPADHADRYDLRVLPISKMAGFDTLETQRLSIETLVEWLDSLFPAAASPEALVERADAGHD
jgi:dienelactone hydrolase